MSTPQGSAPIPGRRVRSEKTAIPKWGRIMHVEDVDGFTSYQIQWDTGDIEWHYREDFSLPSF